MNFKINTTKRLTAQSCMELLQLRTLSKSAAFDGSRSAKDHAAMQAFVLETRLCLEHMNEYFSLISSQDILLNEENL